MGTNNPQSFRINSSSFNEKSGSLIKKLKFQDTFSDVTLIADKSVSKGRVIHNDLTFSAHQIVLSNSSAFFKDAIQTAKRIQGAPASPVVLFLAGIGASTVKSALDFIYEGDVTVPKDEIKAFVRAAKSLQIEGLFTIKNSDFLGDSSDDDEEDIREVSTVFQSPKSLPRSDPFSRSDPLSRPLPRFGLPSTPRVNNQRRQSFPIRTPSTFHRPTPSSSQKRQLDTPLMSSTKVGQDSVVALEEDDFGLGLDSDSSVNETVVPQTPKRAKINKLNRDGPPQKPENLEEAVFKAMLKIREDIEKISQEWYVEDSPYRCGKCPGKKCVRNMGDMKRHIFGHLKSEESTRDLHARIVDATKKASRDNSDEGETGFTCKLCSRVTPSLGQMEAHIGKFHLTSVKNDLNTSPREYSNSVKTEPKTPRVTNNNRNNKTLEEAL